jgi:hypothetical protein
MALPINGGGYQVGDGNANEVDLYALTAPQTATTTATLTAAQMTGGLLVASPGAVAASYTLPTGALMDAAVQNARPDTCFQFNVVNLGSASGVITVLVGTGWTLVGAVTIAIATSAQFVARQTAAATWTLYRVA